MTVDAPPRSAPVQDTGRVAVGWTHVAVLVSVLLLTLVVYALGVLLPYYVNDLHRLPLTEVAGGGHDPEDLWPRGGWAGPLTAAGLAGVVFAPAVALIAVGVGSAWLASLWRRPAAGRTALSVALVLVVTASLAALLFLLSDTGLRLEDWRLG